MNLFQIITLPLVGLLLIHSILSLIRRKQSRGMGILSIAIWLAAGIAILEPQLTIKIAALMGIGRGADLVLYILAIVFILAVFFIYNKLRSLESSITEIVRHLSLNNAKTPEQDDVNGMAQRMGETNKD